MRKVAICTLMVIAMWSPLIISLAYFDYYVLASLCWIMAIYHWAECV